VSDHRLVERSRMKALTRVLAVLAVALGLRAAVSAAARMVIVPAAMTIS